MNKIFKTLFFLLLSIHFSSFQGIIIRALYLSEYLCTSHLYAVVITEFSEGLVSGSGPSGITAGPDGNLWFTDNNANKIGQITPDGVITEFGGLAPGSNPLGITAGPDGDLWFLEGNAHNIGQITTAGVVINQFPLAIFSLPFSITAGSDGNLWFTEFGIQGFTPSQIGKITTAGAITEFGGLTANSGPLGITAGPDNNLWFTENKANQIGKITTAGAITEFGGLTSNSSPWAITTGPDGNLWFTENEANKIGQITTAGVILNEFTIPTSNSRPKGITAGPDGNLWFVESSGNNIGRITTDGVITEFPIPAPGSIPIDITTGPDGNLWFTLFSGAIGKITQFRTTTTTLTAVTPNPANLGQSVTLTANVVPSTITGTIEFFDGEVSIGVGILSGGQAELTVNSFAVGTHSLTAVYSGDVNFMGSRSSIVSLTVNSNIFPPRDAKGFQKANKFASQTELVNILTWKAPSHGGAPVAYRLYLNPDLTELLAEVPADASLKFKHHNRRERKTYTYYIISVDEFGNTSIPAQVVIRGSAFK